MACTECDRLRTLLLTATDKYVRLQELLHLAARNGQTSEMVAIDIEVEGAGLLYQRHVDAIRRHLGEVHPDGVLLGPTFPTNALKEEVSIQAVHRVLAC